MDNRFRSSWDISLAELRQSVFRCGVERYSEYKYFKRDILDKAISEVNEKTDLTFAYEPVRVGRKITKIKFKLIKDEVTLSLEEDPNQMTLFDYNEQLEEEDPLALSIEALPDNFTREQIIALRELALPHLPFDIINLGERERWLYHYFVQKVKLMNAEGNVKHPYGWLKKAVAEDW